MVKEVDYMEAKASYNLSKKLYADKLPSELTNTCIVALVSLRLHHVDDVTQVGVNPTHVQGSDYINASFVQVRTWDNLKFCCFH